MTEADFSEDPLSPWAPPPTHPLSESNSGHDLWALSKQIDLLDGEWTYNIFGQRAWNFHHEPNRVYCSLRNFDDAWLSVWMTRKAVQMGVQEDALAGTMVSFRYWASMLNSEDGRVPMPGDGDHYMGRHAVPLIGISDRDELMFFTGWSGWARGDGIGILTREYLNRYQTGYMMSQAWDVGPLGHTTMDLFNAQSPDAFRRLWQTPRRASEVLINDEGAVLTTESTWNYSYACEAQILTIRDGSEGIKLASCILFHQHGPFQKSTRRPKTTRLVDLFVWPPFRERGYGSLLEVAACYLARTRNSERILADVWMGDCVRPERRQASLAFLHRLGYRTFGVEDTQLQYRGEKRLA